MHAMHVMPLYVNRSLRESKMLSAFAKAPAIVLIMHALYPCDQDSCKSHEIHKCF